MTERHKRAIIYLINSLLMISMFSGAGFALCNQEDAGKATPRKEYVISPAEVPVEAISLEVVIDDQKTFPEDLTVVVKNLSPHPIYYLRIACSLPGTREFLGGAPTGFEMIYGRQELEDDYNKPQPDDIPIKSGEKAQVKIAKKWLENLRATISKQDIPASALRKAVLYFQVLYYEDGTGYLTNGKTRKRSS